MKELTNKEREGLAKHFNDVFVNSEYMKRVKHEKSVEKMVELEELDNILICPTCGTDVQEFKRVDEYYEPKHCPECGQSLKWEK